MRPEQFLSPLTLAGTHVELVPLTKAHAAALFRAVRDPKVQQYLVRPVGSTLSEVEATIDYLLQLQKAGTDLPFATRLRATGEVVGMTRYLRIDPQNDSVDIGGTFLDSTYWRTPLNTDAKLTMLRHAFDNARVHRVSLQTDLRNERSQAAIARLGAVREGLLREDRHLANGYYRSSVIYSILVGEWPSVRDRLERSLRKPWSPGSSGRPAP